MAISAGTETITSVLSAVFATEPRQDVEQKPGCRVQNDGIESLRHRYEADAVVFEQFDVVQAVHDGAPKAVQFPDQQH